MSDQPIEAGPTPAQPPAPQPQQPPAEPASEPGQETFSKEYVQELRQEAAQRRTALKEMQEQYQQLEAQLKEQQTAQEKAKETQLKEQGKYKELFEEASQKLAKFTDIDKQSARMQEAISAVLQTQRDGIPDHITALLDKLDLVEQLEWLANYRQALAEPEPQKTQGKQTVQQQLAGFNPSGGNGTQENDQQRIARLQQKAGVGVSVFGSQR